MSDQNSQLSQFSKAYDPSKVELDLYQKWESKGCFKADPASTKKSYSIVIPPPNVTGMLTMGHVLNNTLQDILIRYQCMNGREVLWMPGTDHAGIATQNVVEKELAKEKITRHDLGREKFLERVWQWKEKYGSIILQQLKKLGCSCDWERERFTMDDGLTDAVKESFVKLYNDGLIYKGKYIINWCPRCQTALSDEEKIPEVTAGSLWHIRYPIKDSDAYIVVATTRPETMLGDTAVAVNPKDERYANLVGKKVVLPFVNREIPIIVDEYVDASFGTGAVKITPAHDPNDFEVALRHNLEQVVVMNEAAVMNEMAGPFEGLDRFEAREQVITQLEQLGLLDKIEDHELAVGHCERCKTIIEPYVSEQWFVKMKSLAKPAIDAVKSGKLRFTPSRWVSVYLHWMENIRDWCISRQLWWGHRIPAYICQDCKNLMVANEMPETCSKCKSVQILQEEDVLDTWFSSWLWPFSTMGWPENTEILKRFYPTDTLVTGPDIIFFWVARMVMAGYYFVGECPFHDVYFTSIVRDMKGRKMSKSLGNSPDPLKIINDYGADALRYTIISIAPIGQDIKFSDKQVEIGRNFANKLWNASRFVMMNLESSEISIDSPLPKTDNMSVADLWILSRLNSAIGEVAANLSEGVFKFNDALKAIYEFVWVEYCDWYIEMTKADLFGTDPIRKQTVQTVLLTCLNKALHMLHPFMPFVTEKIWQHLPQSKGFLMQSSFPVSDLKMVNVPLEQEMDSLFKAVRVIRNLRASANIKPSAKVKVRVVLNDATGRIFEDYSEMISYMSGLEQLEIIPEKPSGHLVGLVDSNEVCLELAGVIDLEAEKNRIEKELAKLEKEMAKVSVKLEDQSFTKKAPSEVVAKIQQAVADYSAQIDKLQQYNEQLKGM